MVEFTIIPSDSDEPSEDDLPGYKDPGRILFEIYHIYRCGDQPTSHTRYEIEVHDYDSGSSVMWLQEGQGIDYWLQDVIDLEGTGFYVVEGVTGTYYRGDGWSTDDDEEWEFTLCRRATLEEISSLALS